jgi:hypothetical protein
MMHAGGSPMPWAGDGVFTFYPGRLYRVLGVVNGPTYLEDVEAMLASVGFGPIWSSAPHAWTDERPPDWPDERPLPEIAANETLVRMTAGTGAMRAPVQVGRDVPIPDASGAVAARFAVARAWDYGDAPPVTHMVGQTSPATPAKKSSGGLVALVAAGGLAAVGFWHHFAEQRRLKREEQRLASAEVRAERDAIARDASRILGSDPREYGPRSVEDLDREQVAVLLLEAERE